VEGKESDILLNKLPHETDIRKMEVLNQFFPEFGFRIGCKFLLVVPAKSYALKNCAFKVSGIQMFQICIIFIEQ